MILTAHQPVYLPWLGLFHKIALADTFVSFDGVQYLKKDWNNRNWIKTSDGPLWLTVPVFAKGHRDKTIAEIRIDNSRPWRRTHWRSIVANYRKAKFFDDYAPLLELLYSREWLRLSELNEAMLRAFLDTLGIGVRFLRASDHTFLGRKSELVRDMCVQLGAKVYIFGGQGREYARVDDFRSRGVEVHFQQYEHPTYPQLHGPFVPNMSVIDLLFNCGPESLEILMSGNVGRLQVREVLRPDLGM